MNPFLFLDIINTSRIMLFVKEILNFTRTLPYYCSLQGGIIKKGMLDTIQRCIFIEVAKRVYYEMVS